CDHSCSTLLQLLSLGLNVCALGLNVCALGLPRWHDDVDRSGSDSDCVRREANYVNMQLRMDGRTCNIKQKYVKSQTPRMERAATTASSLEAEQDNGNINRT
ncbi:hypothetical protein Tco_1513330, partial [Tanacetum coccineum]